MFKNTQGVDFDLVDHDAWALFVQKVINIV